MIQDRYSSGSNQTNNIYNESDEEIHPMNNENDSSQNNTYDLMKNLDFSIHALNSTIQLKENETQTVTAMINLETNELKGSARSGVDLICVIDRSGSMYGDKMEMVHHTLKQLLNFLKETDRLCLVEFDTSGRRLTSLLRVIPRIEQTSGGDIISKGTEVAFEQIKKRKYKNNVTSIFLLSDGQDGSAEKQVRAQLKQFKEPFTIHSFGFGKDHDAKMMAALCSMRNGNFYFCHEISFLDQFFADALGGLVSVVGEDIEISLKLVAQAPFNGIRISKTYGDMWQKLDDLNYRIKIPYIPKGNRRNYVFELTIPKYDSQIGNLPKVVSVIHTTLELKSTQTGQIVKKQSNLKINILGENDLITEIEEKIEVAAQIVRVQASETIDKARMKCEEQKYEQAQVLLDTKITDIQKKDKVAKASKKILKNLNQAKQAARYDNFNTYGKGQMIQIVLNNQTQAGITANFDENGVQNQEIDREYSNNAQNQLVNQVIQGEIQGEIQEEIQREIQEEIQGEIKNVIQEEIQVNEDKLSLMMILNALIKWMWTVLLSGYSCCLRFIIFINQEGKMKVSNSETSGDINKCKYKQGNSCYSVVGSLSKDQIIMANEQDDTVLVRRKVVQINE